MSKIRVSLDDIKAEVYNVFFIEKETKAHLLKGTESKVKARLSLIRISYIFSKYDFVEIGKHFKIPRSSFGSDLIYIRKYMKSDKGFIHNNNLIVRNLTLRYG